MVKSNLKEDVSKEFDTPVLLTLHVRTNNLRNQLEVFRKVGLQRLYISIDGPRDEADLIEQSKIDKIITECRNHFPLLKIRKADTNLGLAVGMISAIDWFFLENKTGIVVEDDLQFAPEALVFFKEALPKIEKNPQILLVGGSQPFPATERETRVRLTNYPQIWGWASTEEKWSEMRRYFHEIPNRNLKIDLSVKNFWRVGWLRVQQGYLDTWDLPIATGMRLDDKYCLLPPVNLISNIGVDGHSTNTTKNIFPLGEPVHKGSISIDYEVNLDHKELEILNRLFEKEIYKVKKRNALSIFLRPLDRFRKGIPRRRPLSERLNTIHDFRIVTYE